MPDYNFQKSSLNFALIKTAKEFLYPVSITRSPMSMDNAKEQPNQNDEPQQVILFRSKLTDKAGEDYQAMNDELAALVRENPGFVDVKSYTAQDGERLTLVWWRDEKSLADWRNLMRHREAQNSGPAKVVPVLQDRCRQHYAVKEF
ncbi:MAG TPA: hypothetical protein VFR24_20040 [Candidatus Angelobacter sp.]|nr:hypothetical protein [Candidatus Angelobacter sp.]